MDELNDYLNEVIDDKMVKNLISYFEKYSQKQIKELIEICSSKQLISLIDSLVKIYGDFLKNFKSNPSEHEIDIKLLNSCCIILQNVIDIHSQNEVLFKLADLTINLVSILHCQNCTNVLMTEYKTNISYIGYLWIMKRHIKYDKIVGKILFYYLGNCSMSTMKNIEIQRLCELREFLYNLKMDFTIEQIELIKHCFNNESLLSIPNGKMFLSNLLSWRDELIQPCNDAIKRGLTKANIMEIKNYGEVYYLAWSKPLLMVQQTIESEYLENLVYSAIHISRRVKKVTPDDVSSIPLHHTLRILLSAILKKRRVSKATGNNVSDNAQHAPSLLTTLLDPILWKSLSVPNQDVRLNAANIFFDNFPIVDSSQTDVNLLAPKLLKQFDHIKDLLKDPYQMVRLVAINGVCKIMSYHWNAIPSSIAFSFLKYLVKVCVWDLKSMDNRLATLNGLTLLLVKNPSSHQLLKMLLPSTETIIHENSEKLRFAFFNMLFGIKNCGGSGIHYWDVIKIPTLVHQIGIEAEGKGSPAILQRIIQLIYPSFLSTGQASSHLTSNESHDPTTYDTECSRELIERSVALCDMDPVSALRFYKHCCDGSTLTTDDKLRLLNVYWNCLHLICDKLSQPDEPLDRDLSKLFSIIADKKTLGHLPLPGNELEEGEILVGDGPTCEIGYDVAPIYNNLKILHHLLAPTQILLASLEAKVTEVEVGEQASHKKEFDPELSDYSQKLQDLQSFMAQTFPIIYGVVERTSLLSILILIAGYIPLELIPVIRSRIYHKLMEKVDIDDASTQTLDRCIVLTFYHWGDAGSIFRHIYQVLDEEDATSPIPKINTKKRKFHKMDLHADRQNKSPAGGGLIHRALVQLNYLTSNIIAYDNGLKDLGISAHLEKTKDLLRQIVDNFIGVRNLDTTVSDPDTVGLVFEVYLKILLYQHVQHTYNPTSNLSAVYPFTSPLTLTGNSKYTKVSDHTSTTVPMKEFRGLVSRLCAESHPSLVETLTSLAEEGVSRDNERLDGVGCVDDNAIESLKALKDVTVRAMTSALNLTYDSLLLNTVSRGHFEEICIVLNTLFDGIAWAPFAKELALIVQEMFRYCQRIQKVVLSPTPPPPSVTTPKFSSSDDRISHLIQAMGIDERSLDSEDDIPLGALVAQGTGSKVARRMEMANENSRALEAMKVSLIQSYLNSIEACTYRSQLIPQPSAEQLTQPEYHENILFYPIWKELLPTYQTSPPDLLDAVMLSSFKSLATFLIDTYRVRYGSMDTDTNYLQIYTFPYLFLQYLSCLSKRPIYTLFIALMIKFVRSGVVGGERECYSLLVIVYVLSLSLKTKPTASEKNELTQAIQNSLRIKGLGRGEKSKILEEIYIFLSKF